MKRISASLLLLLCVSLLPACASKRATEDAAAKAEVYVETDTTLDMCIYSADTLNPLATSVRHNAEVLSCLYDSLFVVSKDFKATPNLCTQYQLSPDGLKFSARLRHNVCFSDGARLTAQDAAASLETILRSDGYYKSRLGNVRHAAAEGDTLHIFFTQPVDEQICALLDFPILPRGGALEETDILLPPSPGSGLYTLSQYQTNKALVLVRNNAQHSGTLPYFETARIHMAENPETALSMLEQGGIDVLPGYVAPQADNLLPQKLQTRSYPGCNLVFLGMADSFENQAISSAIHRELLLPPDTVAVTYISPNAVKSTHTEKKLPAEPLPASCTLYYCESTLYRRQIALQIQKDLYQIGMDVKLKGVSEEELSRRIARGEYDLFLGEITLMPDFQPDMLPLAESRMIPLYRKQEKLLYSPSVNIPDMVFLNPYQNIHLWKPSTP